MVCNHQYSQAVTPIMTLLIIFAFLLFWPILSTSHAEVTLDGSLGPSGAVGHGTLPDGTSTTYLITDNLGTQVGGNLFHSFGKFNVDTNESATFTGPNSINNIIGRVTGGTQSWIDGLLRSTIDGANLFLLNPAGMLFGPNATLDVKGSFHVSTADYLRFDDGERFYVNPAENSVLTVAPPQAFGFLSESPTRISIQESLLEVPEGETLSVVSGNIEIVGGTLRAASGRINLASVASSGEVIPNAQDEEPGLKMDTFERLGEIDISKDGELKVSGATPGNIFIRGGSLSLDSSGIYSTTHGAAGDLDIRLAEDLSLTNRSYIDSSSYWSGPAGDILLDVGRLTILDGSKITSHAMPDCTSQGGNIMIRAAEFVSISSGGGDNYMQSYISSSTFGNGDGGTISISTPSLTIEEHAGIFAVAYMGFDWMGNVVGGGRAGDIFLDVGSLTITSAGIGCQTATPYNAGNITITATESISIDDGAINSTTWDAGDGGTISISTPVLVMDCAGIDATAEGPYVLGDAGDIFLEVGSLELTGISQIQTSTDGPGQGGDVTVTATDSISISGRITEGNEMYQSAIISSTYGDGNGGTISISTPSLTIDDGALAAETALGAESGGDILVEVGDLTISNGGLISSVAFGSGQGGNVTVTAADSISILGRNIDGLPSGIISGANSGAGGDITLEAPEIELSDGVIISTESFGVGNAGDISITASDTFHSNNSSVTTAAEQAEGGDINITTREMQLLNGTIVSAESSGAGNAGNIHLAATDSFLMRDSAVTTEAKQADGGNIKVSAEYMVYLIDSEITASVGGGPETVGGNINIDPEYVILKNSKIIANAYEGMGGNISIVADVFLADPDSIVDASSALGIDGQVNIRAPVKEITGTFAPLPKDFLSALALLREPCMARIQGGKYSSFVVGGRDGLPLEPGGLLPSPIF
ncbi:MAG: filamentous hemagglutinin N-terminal domain-containing protein [Anaerolineales bacterium]|nr:filamentous hemagglutinin N-terminal domain-containing protein [Anaerolineales bacterium]